MTAPRILLLGEPALRAHATEVVDFASEGIQGDFARLSEALQAFRAQHGFGRAIAAPQIGVPRRMVALCVEGRTLAVANPEITWRSEDTFTLWDDCMCFPGLLVRVRRHRSISLRYQDERGERSTWERLDPATSELLQHEMDHLEGVLAIDRAIDRESMVLREVFDAERARFLGQVDLGDQHGVHVRNLTRAHE